MNEITKLLIGAGVLLIMVGLLWQVGGKFLNLGRLPGDIVAGEELPLLLSDCHLYRHQRRALPYFRFVPLFR